MYTPHRLLATAKLQRHFLRYKKYTVYTPYFRNNTTDYQNVNHFKASQKYTFLLQQKLLFAKTTASKNDINQEKYPTQRAFLTKKDQEKA